MTQVDRTIGVGQGAGNQYSSFLFAHSLVYAAGIGHLDVICNYGTLLGQAVASDVQFGD
jgi:hypothetical protein